MTCRRCGQPIDRDALADELRRFATDIPTTIFQAAESSMFCGLACALADFFPIEPIEEMAQ